MKLPHPPRLQHKQDSGNAVITLLPFCTVDKPLNESQAIALTDAAGSLKELVLLALGAADGDEECSTRLEGAVGGEAVTGITDFFAAEYEID